MKYRKLRIAWSVAWGIVCVLLIALWVRSLYRLDVMFGPAIGSRNVTVTSGEGRLGVVAFWSFPSGNMSAWTRQIYLVENLPDDRETRPLLGFEKRGPLFGFSLLRPTKGNGYTNGDGIGAIVPYWFALLTGSASAAIPWTKIHFSLRTVLIATTLIAMGLGLIVCLR